MNFYASVSKCRVFLGEEIYEYLENNSCLDLINWFKILSHKYSHNSNCICNKIIVYKISSRDLYNFMEEGFGFTF